MHIKDPYICFDNNVIILREFNTKEYKITSIYTFKKLA